MFWFLFWYIRFSIFIVGFAISIRNIKKSYSKNANMSWSGIRSWSIFITLSMIPQLKLGGGGEIEGIFRQYLLFSFIFGFFDISLWQKQLVTIVYNRWYQIFFYFQHTLNKLFNNCIKLHWYYISSSWYMKGVQTDITPEKKQ